jgi:hypothetical protein
VSDKESVPVKAGDRVCYILRQFDADEINGRRDNFQNYQGSASHGIHPHDHDARWTGAPGYVAHIGMRVTAGEQPCADVTKVHESGTLNLRVLLDGTDVQFLRNVPEGTEPGTWQRR